MSVCVCMRLRMLSYIPCPACTGGRWKKAGIVSFSSTFCSPRPLPLSLSSLEKWPWPSARLQCAAAHLSLLPASLLSEQPRRYEGKKGRHESAKKSGEAGKSKVQRTDGGKGDGDRGKKKVCVCLCVCVCVCVCVYGERKTKEKRD